MATLEAVGLSTATYTGDTAMEADCDEMDGNEIDGEEAEFGTGGDEAYGDDNDGGDINDRIEGNNDNDSFSCSFPAHGKQLIILFDCETTGGSHYSDHIIEVAATVIVPDNTSITKEEFSSLCCTSKHISSFGKWTPWQNKNVMLLYSVKEMWRHCTNVVWSAPFLGSVSRTDVVDQTVC